MPTTMMGASRITPSDINRAAATISFFGFGRDGGPSILRILCNPNFQPRELVTVVARQPGLYARVLRVANSAYYGQARSITTIDRALVLLGQDAVRGIVTAACLDRAIPRKGGEDLIDMQSLLTHSLATAAAAEALANIRKPRLAGEAFIAGLLHNLGIILQLHFDSSGVAAMVRGRRLDAARDMRVLEAEQAIVSHEMCVATLLESWQLPEVLIEATRHHHAPMEADPLHRDLASLINLAANMGLAGGSTFSLEPVPVVRDTAAMAWLGFDDAQLDVEVTNLRARVQTLRGALLDG